MATSSLKGIVTGSFVVLFAFLLAGMRSLTAEDW